MVEALAVSIPFLYPRRANGTQGHKMKILISILAISALAGCGVKGSAKVGELSDSDKTALCEESIAAMGDQSTDCGDGLTVEPSTQADCEASLADFAGCDLLVSEYRDCVDAVAADPCNGFADAACAPVMACYTAS